ncbi:hypothetical protein HPB49_007039 [Dermacentor silvarum]|uniref:Uncharacterized protein n=1 Tax=Dermacentor silvarum TaxID=543639 RepID=A0ACB8DBB3_DERSI|nr:hypothetical protein HPB49_007039 [Dermacentor silvarum]
MNGGAQYDIVGPVVSVPVEVDIMVKSLPRNIREDHAINVHIKRKNLNKTSYLSGVVNKSHLKPWLDVLCRGTLYRYFGITLDASSLDALSDDDAFQLLEDSVVPQCPTVHNPVDARVALNVFEQPVVWDEERYLAIVLDELSYDKDKLAEEREALRQSLSPEHNKNVALELQAREERFNKTEDSVRELRLRLLQQQSRMLASEEIGKAGVVKSDENDAGVGKRPTVGLDNFHVSRCDVVNQTGLDNLKSALDWCSDVDGCWGGFENVEYEDREFALVALCNACREDVIKSTGP